MTQDQYDEFMKQAAAAAGILAKYGLANTAEADGDPAAELRMVAAGDYDAFSEAKAAVEGLSAENPGRVE